MIEPTMEKHKDQLNDDEFMRLMLESERELLRYVMALVPDREDSRDVVQETLIALWKKRAKYDPAFPFVPWACRFAMNEIRLHRRRDSRWRWIQDDQLIEMLFSRRQELAQKLDARKEHLRTCLEKLPTRQRNVVEGYYFREEPVEDVAERLNASSDAVYKMLQRVRQALFDCVTRSLQAEEPTS